MRRENGRQLSGGEALDAVERAKCRELAREALDVEGVVVCAADSGGGGGVGMVQAAEAEVGDYLRRQPHLAVVQVRRKLCHRRNQRDRERERDKRSKQGERAGRGGGNSLRPYRAARP